MIKLEYTDKKNWETINSIFSKPLEKNLRISHFFVVVIFFRLILICYSGTDLFFLRNLSNHSVCEIYGSDQEASSSCIACVILLLNTNHFFFKWCAINLSSKWMFYVVCKFFYVLYCVCIRLPLICTSKYHLCVWQNMRINFYIQIDRNVVYSSIEY